MRLVARAEVIKIRPAIEPGRVAIIEADQDGVIADRLNA